MRKRELELDEFSAVNDDWDTLRVPLIESAVTWCIDEEETSAREVAK